MNGPRYRQAEVGGVLHATLETRPDGTQILRSTDTLDTFPVRLTDRLEHWAATAPDRVFVARRDTGTALDGEARITYCRPAAPIGAG